MGIYESVQAVARASGDGAIDWTAVGDAAKGAIAPGSLDLSEDDVEAYAADVREARDVIRPLAGVEFDVPSTVEIQNRHHWIDANIHTFRRVLAPLDDRPGVLPGVARVANTGSVAASLAFIANNVLGQYDPLLLAERPEDHGLYFVHPNVERVAAELDVEFARFRRWIAFHEVTHAAEFGAAPWLTGYLEERVERTITDLEHGQFRTEAFEELDVAMTAVEGYAELLMDDAFDREYADLRAKLEARRRGRDPLTRLLRRLFGLGIKRRQYERGKAFFERVVDLHGEEAARLVWESPENLPTEAELDDPARWVTRVA